MLFDQLQDHRRQQENTDQVGDGHKAVESIADAPDQAQISGGAQNGDQTVGNIERQQDLASQQEFSTAGAIQTPAYDGGKSKAAPRGVVETPPKVLPM